MRFMAEQSYADLVDTKEMLRIKAGPFLELLIEQMLAKVDGTLKPQERKLFLYSAHDWTITNILISLNVWKRQMPEFAALILFELHQNLETKEYYMEVIDLKISLFKTLILKIYLKFQLYFQNGPNGPLESLTLPDCSFQCPVDKVLELLEDVLPTGSYEEMCNLQ